MRLILLRYQQIFLSPPSYENGISIEIMYFLHICMTCQIASMEGLFLKEMALDAAIL